MKPPAAYQGGKYKVAGQILDIIKPEGVFHDLCCGCGAISIELVNRGYNPELITMLDKSPWGLVWQKVGDGTFDLARFEYLCNNIPTDRSQIQKYVLNLSSQLADIDTPYIFLILQASSFGSKAIWIKNNKWMNTSFRSYWLPTETSNRRYPVNPMHPMPKTLIQRMKIICVKMRGITAKYMDIVDYRPESGTVYIDPPYSNTTLYGHNFNVLDYVKNIKLPTFVSEGVPLSNQSYLISTGTTRGGISGNRKNIHQEWLSFFSGS